MVTHTPLHSVLALSLPGRLEGVGAIDLYRVHPVGAMAVDVLEAWAVAERISDHLAVAADRDAHAPVGTPPSTRGTFTRAGRGRGPRGRVPSIRAARRIVSSGPTGWLTGMAAVSGHAETGRYPAGCVLAVTELREARGARPSAEWRC